jgi:hypothetical protein
VPFVDRANRDHHVLAGDIMAAANTDRMAEIIIDFISRLGISNASARPASP